MAATLSQVLGTTRSWTIQAMSGGKPMVGLFTQSDATSASVWPGGTLASLFTPTASWVDPSQATVKVTITAAMIASVTPGTYRIRVTITPVSDGQPRDIYYGSVRFEPADATGAVPASLVTFSDMLTYCSEVAKLQGQDNDLAGFAEQRHRAMNEFAQDVGRRYCPRPGGSRRYVSMDGSAAGPYLRFSASPDGSPPPSRAQVVGWLTPQRVVLNEDVVEANARLSAALVYGTTPGQNNIYQQMAREERRLALAAIDRAAVEIDTTPTPDGIAEIRVDRDVVYLT